MIMHCTVDPIIFSAGVLYLNLEVDHLDSRKLVGANKKIAEN